MKAVIELELYREIIDVLERSHRFIEGGPSPDLTESIKDLLGNLPLPEEDSVSFIK